MTTTQESNANKLIAVLDEMSDRLLKMEDDIEMLKDQNRVLEDEVKFLRKQTEPSKWGNEY